MSNNSGRLRPERLRLCGNAAALHIKISRHTASTASTTARTSPIMKTPVFTTPGHHPIKYKS
ncbi:MULTISPECIES: hypothetical protein [unclassified Novosphingobium]|uniref:hypothetical protein n=1 Tax=unclassified Novosphingobium TaxID=2644732 RepID=UPI00146DD745|nr:MULTISPECIES: hypothetical protein [unclassified Novosphingobium]NMN89420.1 hypothetical protein [Novosphingobium sp. SG916]